MKKISLIFGVAILCFASAQAGSKKHIDSKATINEAAAPSATEAKAGVAMYWFDANTGQYLGHKESSGCDNSTDDACANGYTSVENESQPQEPDNQTPVIARGQRP